MEIAKKDKPEEKVDPATTVTFVENIGGLEKSKSDSKLNQVNCTFFEFVFMFCVCVEILIA